MEKEMITRTSNELSVMDTDLITRWTNFIQVKPKSAATYTRNLKPFFKYCSGIGKTNPADVTREDVIAYQAMLQAEGKTASTVQAYMNAVKLLYNWFESEGVCRNIAKDVKVLAPDAGFKKDNLSSRQAGELLNGIDTDTLQGKRDFAIIALMLTTGLRTVSVSLANVADLEQRTNAMTEKREWVLYYKGKDRNEKSTYAKISGPVLAAITDYLDARGPVKGTDPLFCSCAHRNGGERMTTRSISRICKEHMVDVGMDSARLTAHSLRHTAAILNLLNGGSLEETQVMLNHKDISTTRIYSHMMEREANDSESRVSAAIFGTC